MNTNFCATSSHAIGTPTHAQIPALRSLWKEAFGDTDDFLDVFFQTAFHPDRCHCITIDDQIAAALYWFTCSYQERPVAYIYAVATAKSHRGRGLCHKLLDYTHKHLEKKGYLGALLVPGSKELFYFYEGIGYRICSRQAILEYHMPSLAVASYTTDSATDVCSVTNASSDAGACSDNISGIATAPHDVLRRIHTSEFAVLRRQYLPEHAVIQEQENLTFLETQAGFYTGKDFLLTAAIQNGTLYGIELLGNASRIPEIIEALNCQKGTFYLPPSKQVPSIPSATYQSLPFAMYYSFSDSDIAFPFYFGFAFN